MSPSIVLSTKNATKTSLNLILKANICHKSQLPPQKVYHFPYLKWKYAFPYKLLDLGTHKKFNENSKIIQIEGNVAAGKEKFGKSLADELGMKFYPQPNLEKIFYNKYGFDYRSLNVQLPERMRYCDWNMLHENPTRHSAIHLLYFMQGLRVLQYIEATSHLMNTGQGVVLERSCFTEKVLIDAMHNLGLLPLGYLRADGARFYDWRNRYDYGRSLALCEFLPPVLTIYLDVSPEECKKRIDASSDPMIANSRLLTLPFLEAVKESYETDILERARKYGHLICLDGSQGSTELDMEHIVYDISKMDFERFELNTQFQKWDYELDKYWHAKNRSKFTNFGYLERQIRYLNSDYYDIAGLGDSITDSDIKLREALIVNHVVGFNSDPESDPDLVGWKGYLHIERIPWFEKLERYFFGNFL